VIRRLKLRRERQRYRAAQARRDYRAMVRHAERLRDLTGARYADISAACVLALRDMEREHMRSMADLIAGQMGGHGIAPRRATAGSGSVTRY
jgi:hypothetical protein